MRRLLLALVLLLGALSGPGFAVQPDEMLKDPVLEARARHLSEGLRCLVCQNQSIDDSDATLARDIRLLVREKLKQGMSDAEIRDFLVKRYGDFILLKPPLEWGTLALWATPVLALVFGGFAIFAAARHRRAPESEPALSEAEQRKLDEILAER